MGIYNDKKMQRNFSKKFMNNICFEKEKPENYQEVVEIEKEIEKNIFGKYTFRTLFFVFSLVVVK